MTTIPHRIKLFAAIVIGAAAPVLCFEIGKTSGYSEGQADAIRHAYNTGFRDRSDANSWRSVAGVATRGGMVSIRRVDHGQGYHTLEVATKENGLEYTTGTDFTD